MNINVLKSLFFASRPKTLVAGLCPVVSGASFAFYYVGFVDVFYLSILILASVCIQIATNFFNDAIDADSGRDLAERLGPERAAASGRLSSGFLKKSALALLFISFCLGFILALKVGFWIFLIGLPAMLLAYLYTGTKYSLSTMGTADLFVLIYFGLVPVWTSCYVLSGVNSVEALVSGFQLGLFANALLLINNLRDFDEDSKANKKTLVVRFGRKVGLSLLSICLLGPYALSSFLDPVFFRAGLWSLLVLPLSLFILFKVFKNAPSKTYNLYLGLTALNLLCFTYLFSTGILSS